LIKGWSLLDAATQAWWQPRIVDTVKASAKVSDGLANWPPAIGKPRAGRDAMVVQFCHGAPGIIASVATLPDPELNEVLCQGGELIWQAGPLIKGSNLCHGTAGNGYALLKLYERTSDPRWLARARAFAMHAITQTEAARTTLGRGRYSLWTGDLGCAIFLADCLSGVPRIPTWDVFFAVPATRRDTPPGTVAQAGVQGTRND
jgi:hypothetical protein